MHHLPHEITHCCLVIKHFNSPLFCAGTFLKNVKDLISEAGCSEGDFLVFERSGGGGGGGDRGSEPAIRARLATAEVNYIRVCVQWKGPHAALQPC